jgi:isocitrate dehydrogenase kinase/phosphatase
VFPDEFRTFLGLPAELRAIFTERHAELFGVEFWQQMQQRHRAGEVIDIFPYLQSRRLSRQRS